MSPRVLSLCLSLSLALAGLGCSTKCVISSQCDRGEHCDFTSGECVGGCKSQDDCAPNTRCDPMYGRCEPIPLIRDATTSSTADAGGGDASSGD